MRRLLGLILALVFTLSAAPAARAQQQPDPFEGDKRLEKRITIRWKKATLLEALAELKRATGVAMVPDRAVVDEPVMAAAANVPARDLMRHMATLLHFTWMRSGGTKDAPGYLIFRDVNATREEEEEINKGTREVLEAIQKELARMRETSRLPEDQLKKRLDQANEEMSKAFSGGLAGIGNNAAAARRMQDNMGLYAIAAPTGRAMLSLLDSLTPGQWAQVMQEQPLTISSRPESGEMAMSGPMQDRLRQATPGMPFPKSLFKAFGPEVEGAIGKLEEQMRDQWSKAPGFKVTIQLNLNMGAQPMGMLRVSPAPIEQPNAPDGLNAAMGQMFAVSGLNIVGAPSIFNDPKEDPAVREKRLEADPVLGKKAKLKLPKLESQGAQAGLMSLIGQGHRVADVLPAVEEAFGIHLVADAYNRLALSFIQPTGEAELPLYKVLDQMAGLTRDWERDGDTIRLKSRTWASDRRSEIPARHMQRWLASRTKRGVLSLDDLAEIASILKDAQVENLMYSALEAGASEFTDFMMVTMHRDALRFWAKLLPLQRRALLSGQTIPARSLYPMQQQALMQISKPRTQSLMSIAMPSKPVRTPAQLAEAGIALQVQNLEGQKPGEPAPNLPGIGSFPGIYTLRVIYPNGQKDEYQIPLTRPTPPGAKGAQPVAPPPPAVQPAEIPEAPAPEKK